MDSPSQNGQLPYDLEQYLLWILSSESRLNKEKFNLVCNQLQSRKNPGVLVFGDKGSTIRRTIQKRRTRLLAYKTIPSVDPLFLPIVQSDLYCGVTNTVQSPFRSPPFSLRSPTKPPILASSTCSTMDQGPFPEPVGNPVQLTFEGTGGYAPIFVPGLICQEQKGIRSKAARGGKETAIVSMIRTYVPIFDPRDILAIKVPTGKKDKQGNIKYRKEFKVKARLMDEGQGFLLWQPRVPHVLGEKLSSESDCRLFSKKLVATDVEEDPYPYLNNRKEDTLLTANNNLGTNLWTRSKQFGEETSRGGVVTSFLFPDGYSGNNARFNKGGHINDDLTLEVKPHIVTSAFIYARKKLTNVQAWAVIDVAVDDHLVKIDASSSSEDDGDSLGENLDDLNMDRDLLQSFQKMAFGASKATPTKRKKTGEDHLLDDLLKMSGDDSFVKDDSL
jgi:hypothetical protein